MNYRIEILRRAQKELADLPKEVYQRVCESIQSLAEDFRPSGCVKLKGREGWRIRVGNYRILYQIDDQQKTVTIVHIGHRRDVYEK
jgi:mRNA interferase RelE/StbE